MTAISHTEIPFISQGSERYASGVKDNKGRDCGSTVIYGVRTETGIRTTYVHANRDGKDFCVKSGSFKEFPDGINGIEAQDAWVISKVREAKERAAKRWAEFN